MHVKSPCNMTPQLTVHSNIAPLTISCTGQGQLPEAATLWPNGKVRLDAIASVETTTCMLGLLTVQGEDLQLAPDFPYLLSIASGHSVVQMSFRTTTTISLHRLLQMAI